MAEEEPLDLLEGFDYEETPEEKERIMRIYDDNRASLINFFKQLVEMGEGEIPKKMLEEAGRSERMDAAEDLMYKNLDILKNGGLETDEETALLMHKLCLAYFLLDRSRKLEELAVKSNNVSLYMLYLSLEERVCDMLSEDYYGSSLMEIMDAYLDMEPVLAACSDLCGLVVPPMEEILKENQENWLRQQLLLP